MQLEKHSILIHSSYQFEGGSSDESDGAREGEEEMIKEEEPDEILNDNNLVEGLRIRPVSYDIESEEDLVHVIDQMNYLCEQLSHACDDLTSEVTKLKLIAYTHNVTLPPMHESKESETVPMDILDILSSDEDLTSITVPDYESESEESSMIEHEYDVSVSETESHSEEDDQYQTVDDYDDEQEEEDSMEMIETEQEMNNHHNETIENNEQEVKEEQTQINTTTTNENEENEHGEDTTKKEMEEPKPRPKSGSITPLVLERPSDPILQPLATGTKEQIISFYDDGFMECENIVDDNMEFGIFGDFDESKFGVEKEPLESKPEPELHRQSPSNLDKMSKAKSSNDLKESRKSLKKIRFTSMFSSSKPNLTITRSQSMPNPNDDYNSLTDASSLDSATPSIPTKISKLDFESMERGLFSLFNGDTMYITKRGSSKSSKRFVWVDTQRMVICWNKGSSKNPKYMKEFPISEIRMGTFLANVTITPEENNRSFTVWSKQNSQLLFTAYSESLRNDWVNNIAAILEIKHRTQ